MLRGRHPETPKKQGDDFTKNKDYIRVSVRLSEEENEKLERCAELCGISQNEFIRQLCKGKMPRPKPPKAFWEMLNALYEVHNSFQKCSKYEPSALNICKEIECLIIDLQEAV